ncbi:MAG TPA: 16S rRNA (uracil(1498)-N(3))-methyltransferase [Nitrospirae bacterium]|nr:ribosomal RNA small subunit methyltransferase E [bacterium BMS3Bbin08]HDK17132.1 16S rRNA (uracil(1498)-N(3))-methyltransferase [Nitrospirota bacterium]HDO25568.1 16S rRNA (uracil(1498)-N(3))-methyltransferase [Nitrospirota bacterium]
MIRIFLPPDELTSEQITITGEQAKHLSVLRVKPDDQVFIFDGVGNRYTCEVLQSHKKEVTARLIKKEPYSTQSPISIVLAQGIPKGDKMDLIVQKATELGVNNIVPLISERSQIRKTSKKDRWEKIALSASQQSGREKVPNISEPLSYDEFIYSCSGETPSSAGILLYEEEKTRKLKEVLGNLRHCKRIVLLVGPEGGFSKKEAQMAIEKNFISVSLGPRILRTETAPITAISIIQYELGDMG